MQSQKIKVKVSALRERLLKIKQERVWKHQADIVHYDHMMVAWMEDARQALSRALVEFDKGPVPPPVDRYERRTLAKAPRDRPEKPELSLGQLDADIALLDMASEEDIIISTDSDWVKYLR